MYPRGPNGAVLNKKMVAEVQVLADKLKEDLKEGLKIEEAVSKYTNDKKLQELIIEAFNSITPPKPKPPQILIIREDATKADSVRSQRVYERLSKKTKSELD